MSDFSCSRSAPAHWQGLCERHNALFGSPAWQQVLQTGLGGDSFYLASETGGAAITAFRAGPFRVGYFGFPAGTPIGELPLGAALLQALRSAAGRPVCLRIPVSAFGDRAALDLPCQRNPETAIADLQSWDLASVSKNLRRDIRKAERSGLTVSADDTGVTGADLYALYAGTVKRRGGALRYTSAYFQAVTELARSHPGLSLLVARAGSQLAGFAITARHGDTAYYLHGAAHPEHRQSSPSDLLLCRAIAAARSAGCISFNLMASPPDQPTLVRYKEKWGAETRELWTYTLKLRRSYPLFAIAEALYRRLR